MHSRSLLGRILDVGAFFQVMSRLVDQLSYLGKRHEPRHALPPRVAVILRRLPILAAHVKSAVIEPQESSLLDQQMPSGVRNHCIASSCCLVPIVLARCCSTLYNPLLSFRALFPGPSLPHRKSNAILTLHLPLLSHTDTDTDLLTHMLHKSVLTVGGGPSG